MENDLSERASYIFGSCEYDQILSKLIYPSKKEIQAFLDRYKAEKVNFYNYYDLSVTAEVNQTQFLDLCNSAQSVIKYRKLAAQEVESYDSKALQGFLQHVVVVDEKSQYALLAIAQIFGDYFISVSSGKWKWIDYINKRPKMLYFGFPVIENSPGCISPIQTIFTAAGATDTLTADNFLPHILKTLNYWLAD
jgi:hypothetical protein